MVHKFLKYCVALVLILAVLAAVVHHTNLEGLMRKIHGGSRRQPALGASGALPANRPDPYLSA